VLRSEKKEFVAELEGIYRENSAVIVAHYHGLTVSNISKLRKNLRQEGAGFKVVKNTLARIAANNVGYADTNNLFKGPVAIAYSSDPVSAAKVVAEFAKTSDALKIVGGIVSEQIVDARTVDQLSKLPSMNELRSQLVALIQTPATKIAGVVQAPAAQLARVMKAYSTK